MLNLRAFPVTRLTKQSKNSFLKRSQTSLICVLSFNWRTRPSYTLHHPLLVGGTCAFHITQHQKNEFSVGVDYHHVVWIVDSVQDTIGGINALPIPGLQTASADSRLPFTLDIISGLIDTNPIAFRCVGQQLDTESSQCSIGDFDSGDRDGDCSFTC